MAAASINLSSHSLRTPGFSCQRKSLGGGEISPTLRAAGLFEDSLEVNLNALFVVRCKTRERGSASQVFSI